MNEKITPLVLTPEPYTGESFHGFVLRISELNGYGRPSDMLRYAGLSENEIRSARLPTDKLARLFARSSDSLFKLAYDRKEGSRYGKTLHILGYRLPVSYLSIKEQKVCPRCIQEQGYIDAFWDLRIATVCPLHGVPAVTHCPSCEKTLSWFRPGLLKCGCGAVITPENGVQKEGETALALLEVVWRKLHGHPLGSVAISAAGLPLEHLDRMSLRTLLAVIDRFENLGRKAKSVELLTGHVTFATAALVNWPHGFYDFMETVGSAKVKRYGSAGLARQFRGFQQAFLKADLPTDEISFIWKAFSDFGSERWKKGLIDRKLKGVEKSAISAVGGISEVARRIGVQPGTVHRLVETAIIDATKVERGGKLRLLFDMSQAMPRRTNKGISLGPREAARRLEIPISVLSVLRSNRVYKVRWIGARLGSYHDTDIERFRNRLLTLASHCESEQLIQNRDRFSTLAAIMRMKVGDPVAKAEVIKKLLAGSLAVHGCETDGPGGLLINRADAIAVVRETAIGRSNNLYATQAAKKLGCDPQVIPWLVANGLLEGEPSARGLMVSVASVSAFANEYVACAVIAKVTGTSTRQVLRECRSRGLKILNAERSHGKSNQPFVCRAEAIYIGYKIDLGS